MRRISNSCPFTSPVFLPSSSLLVVRLDGLDDRAVARDEGVEEAEVPDVLDVHLVEVVLADLRHPAGDRHRAAVTGRGDHVGVLDVDRGFQPLVEAPPVGHLVRAAARPRGRAGAGGVLRRGHLREDEPAVLVPAGGILGLKLLRGGEALFPDLSPRRPADGPCRRPRRRGAASSVPSCAWSLEHLARRRRPRTSAPGASCRPSRLSPERSLPCRQPCISERRPSPSPRGRRGSP